MPSEGDVLYKSREEIVAELRSAMQAVIPDVYLGPDGNLSLLFEVLAGVDESVFMGIQIVSEDMFIRTASEGALEAHGDEMGIPRKQGTPSLGEVLFAGQGGVTIPLNSEIAYDPGTGEDPLYFLTTETGVIPNPGLPTAPVLAAGGAGTLPAGTYEYGVTFVTAQGETEIGEVSIPLVKATTNQIAVSSIPVGGPGTIARHLYRRVDGGNWQRVTGAVDTALANNSTTSVADGTTGLGAILPPDDSTAERIVLDVKSDDAGEIYNVLPNTITVLTAVPDGITSVTNSASLTGGSERELVEDYRQRLLAGKRAPQSGAPLDMQAWAEEIEGVETATVYSNDNMGVAANGHVTVRISGPNGAVPSAAVIDEVYAALVAQDVSNVTIHVGTFTPTTTNVTVATTLASGYLLADVTPGVQKAIADYTNSLSVGETWRVSGAISAAFGLPGVIDVTITTPATNQATGATSKRVSGTVTVT